MLRSSACLFLLVLVEFAQERRGRLVPASGAMPLKNVCP